MDFQPIYKKNLLILGNPKSQIGIVTLWSLSHKIVEGVDASLYVAVGQLYSSTRGL